MKLQFSDLAISFYEQYNDIEFNSIEVERCVLLFIERVEMVKY